MSLPKIFAFFSLLVFGLIGTVAIVKGTLSLSPKKEDVASDYQRPIEITLDSGIQMAVSYGKEARVVQGRDSAFQELGEEWGSLFTEEDRTGLLFSTTGAKFPFVETISYKSRVSWKKGRPAWLSDYANYFSTSRHFIARSLRGKPDYFKQDLAEGDRFNVFKEDHEISFHIVVDASLCKMWLYCYDVEADQNFLIKTYPVGLGERNEFSSSGLLTPFGAYSLGDRVAIYNPSSKGWHKGEKIDMVSVFGTRWIPLMQDPSSEHGATGLGIHGIPWKKDQEGEWFEGGDGLGAYDSDGCIRLRTEDVEELFSIVITKPTELQIVKEFSEASIPGNER